MTPDRAAPADASAAEIAAAKAALRDTIRAKVAAWPPEARAAASATICARLLPLLPHTGLIAAYVAMPDEVDLGALLAPLAEAGRLVLPRVARPELTLHAAPALSALARSRFGILEPGPDAPRVAPADLAAVLVPGRAFSARGDRLGRGAGFYDRLLAALRPETARIGVAWSLQHVDAVPVAAHDLPVDRVVTEG